MWVFKGASGQSVCEIYYILKNFIAEERKRNPYYAIEFETLVKK